MLVIDNISVASRFYVFIFNLFLQLQIFIHDGKNFNRLQNMIGYEYLPAEYGGPSTNQLNVEILLNHLLKHSNYLLKLQSYKKK